MSKGYRSHQKRSRLPNSGKFEQESEVVFDYNVQYKINIHDFIKVAKASKVIIGLTLRDNLTFY